jgi:hypothetical protein
MRKLVILSIVAFVAVMVAAPSVMAKKALNEDELDMITAAGQPKIIQTGTGSITFTDTPNFSITLFEGSQTNLSALVLNNLAGELQMANAINVATFLFGVGPEQTNVITQSWGATKDWTSSSVAGVTASATAAASASSPATASCYKCGVVIANAGNAAAAAAASTSAASGVIKVLTKYADQIIETEDGDITVEQNGVSALFLDTGSQTALSALVVNNVVGLSQVANGINVMSGGVSANPGFPAFQLGAITDLRGAGAQSNTINQFRGTPYSRPAAP